MREVRKGDVGWCQIPTILYPGIGWVEGFAERCSFVVIQRPVFTGISWLRRSDAIHEGNAKLFSAMPCHAMLEE